MARLTEAFFILNHGLKKHHIDGKYRDLSPEDIRHIEKIRKLNAKYAKSRRKSAYPAGNIC